MENKKLIRKDLANWIYENQDNLFYKINKQDSDRIVLQFIDFLQEKLSQGYKIEIRGFGTFYIKTLKPTVKTIPIKKYGYARQKTLKQKVQVKERKTVKFIPSTILREYVNPESHIDEKK